MSMCDVLFHYKLLQVNENSRGMIYMRLEPMISLILSFLNGIHR